MDASGDAPASQGGDKTTPDTPAPKAPIRLSYEDYKHMANLMVLHMRRQEEEAGEYTFFFFFFLEFDIFFVKTCIFHNVLRFILHDYHRCDLL